VEFLYKKLQLVILLIVFAAFFILSPVVFANDEASISVLMEQMKMIQARLSERDSSLHRLAEETEALKKELAEKDAEIRQMKETLSKLGRPQGQEKKTDASQRNPLTTGLPFDIKLGGQYRINSYSVNNGVDGDHPTASRVRIRQNLDFIFSREFNTHLQFELGHTNDNISTTNSSSRRTDISIRHAVMDYTFRNGVEVKAGIVPFSDAFDDMLFSSDWNYNPVAFSMEKDLGTGRLRVFGAQLNEGDEPIAHDDFSHYQIDYRFKPAESLTLNTGVTYADIADAYGTHTKPHINYGLGAMIDLGMGLKTKAILLGSHTDRHLLASSRDGEGIASKIELTGTVGRNRFGLMGTYASGERDGTGFLPVMAFAKTYGYWGYTGLLTVQGPTDTGFDGDAVNISNNGYGLTTFQAKYIFALRDDTDVYLGAGWFGNSRTPSGRSSYVGTDLLAMLTYHFTKILALDAGMAYAHLTDGVSGYSKGVIGGAVFNNNTARDKTAFFTRLQAEF
jgi:hypothetical protein